jgi:alanyl-tRNA synthetase
MAMNANELRESFLSFFEERGHRRVPSSSLVPGDDPTLLFTNAGMNQFKDVFLGAETRDYARATSSQKCLRVSGKHNDLEQVGRTARHHTFFEMLGNFSFGDYFKRDAIRFAHEFLVQVCSLDPELLWYTVFAGEAGFAAEEEAYDLWIEEAGAPAARVLRLGEKDNFWRMGDTGPCGPCTEIHFDQGAESGCGNEDCSPACDCDRYLEIWNLVFMQFDQRADGSVRDLPAPSVDTGMGLERLAAVVQGVPSNYGTDLFRGILQAVGQAVGRPFGQDAHVDVSLQVIADHLRAITFLVSDGVTPASGDRGYVVRRVLRRAATHAHLLGQEPPFLFRFIPTVVQEMGDAYPEIREQCDYVVKVCRMEEESFRDTLQRGHAPLGDLIRRASDAGLQEIPGEEVFPLYDSLGLPLDQIVATAHQAGLRIAMAGFQREMDRQKKRSQAAWKGGADAGSQEFYRDLAGRMTTHFKGYDTLMVEDARVLGLLQSGTEVKELSGEGGQGEVILDRSPFYAEAGGQIGDVGTLSCPDGSVHVRVLDTVAPVPGLVVHRVQVERGTVRMGASLMAQVDAELRPETMRNHTATHLLHAALQEVLGLHARQAGSYVGPDRLRFDFNHMQAMTAAEIRQVEERVNTVILENRPVSKTVMDRDEAVSSGAIAFFGEKYGDQVRVVDVPGFSRELCGGTHCHRTGQIGPFRILSERGVSAGVRRVEAVTGRVALQRFATGDGILARMEAMLSVPREKAEETLQRNLGRQRELEKEVERLKLKLAAAGTGQDLSQEVRKVDGVQVLAREVAGLDRSAMRNLADSLKAEIQPGIVVLGSTEGKRVSLLVSVTEDLRHRVDAREVVRELAGIVGGGGGGHATMAEAGGRDPERLGEALAASTDVVERLLGAS